MNLKTILKNTIIIFLLSTIFHFIYDIFPSFITSLFFPVNESIWEHLKIIFTSSLVYTFINNRKNKFLMAYSRSIITTIILLSIYLPINYLFGEKLVITLIILFISILISELLLSRISKEKDYKFLNIISLILLIINYIIFIIFTYYPPKNYLFLDNIHNQYGIIK